MYWLMQLQDAFCLLMLKWHKWNLDNWHWYVIGFIYLMGAGAVVWSIVTWN